MRHARTIAVIAAVLFAAGCGGSDAPSRSASDAAATIESAVSEISKTVDLTSDTDPNNLLGRSSGYDAATVIYDSRVDCDSPGVICGATIEQWPDHDGAQRRADMIKGLQEGSTLFGTEYDYIDGNLLLRVTGQLNEDQAQQYADALSRP